jgi:uncharacterized surface protein with fasciclin (FAS1) repeats
MARSTPQRYPAPRLIRTVKDPPMKKLLIAIALPFAFSTVATPALAGNCGSKAHSAKADIVDTAVAAGQFKTLAAALQAAGLVDTLKSAGKFTVFAPTDAAFAKLPAGTVETLLKPENKDKLVSILTYHVLPKEVWSAALVGKTLEAKTVQGTTVAIDGTKGVKVDGATVVKADVYASNGVIHVIDSVIMP